MCESYVFPYFCVLQHWQNIPTILMPVLCTAYHKVFLMVKMNNIKKREDYRLREVLLISLWGKMFVYISLSFREFLKKTKKTLMIVMCFLFVLCFVFVLLPRLYTCSPSPLHTLKRKLISFYYYLINSTPPSPNSPYLSCNHAHTHTHHPALARMPTISNSWAKKPH